MDEMTSNKTESFNAHKVLSHRTAIIAGNGTLPIAVAQALFESGHNPFLIPLKNESDPCLYAYEHCEISVVQLSKLIKTLKKKKVKNVVLAGGVKSRPNFYELRPDWITLTALPVLMGALGRGDDALLKAFINLLEKHGFHVVGAHEIVPEILAPFGFNLTDRRASKEEFKDIQLAQDAAILLGKLDVGQGAVAVRGRVVALEGAEGTDHMLRRIQEMRLEKRIPLKGGVLVKLAKPQQEERADLPTIGPNTIQNAFNCGLSGVAVEAEKSFIVELKETVNKANEFHMFIETFGKKSDG
ncbi:LpxI family protein [Bartonella tamiae]|uniref:UDP-2,3-diacylglucosamine pyrophosphatase n=1 Tax=Bartonella tamiae Th239 TaxID=1094558 RepID=J1JUK8_9HYPH|nr:UDP-2,3-diacylglucosamine diphosphatase LpxI [Bartonella tamiae]EJF88637.1 hypothetical protein ME5_01188 [Bartonella tamiae Th239]EJF95113.1 hypothetical protein MEG_00694 [Bartonella tamiae Th307]